MKSRVIIATVAALGVWACGQGAGADGEGAAESQEDTLTTAERDSVMSELPIPGIGGIQGARSAAEAARERAEVHDSIG